MRLFNPSVSDASPSSYRSLPIDVDNDDTHDADEILQMDKRGISDVSLSTRLTLRKNNEPSQSDDPGDKVEDQPKRKRGRPKKGSQPIPKPPKQPKTALKQTKLKFPKKRAPEPETDQITAILQNLDNTFKLAENVTDATIFDSSSLPFSRVDKGSTLCPLIAQNEVANIGILKISPSNHYGPFHNAKRGFIVMVVLNCAPGKLEFDSGHANLGPAKCNNNSQLLVCPDDVFILLNRSENTEAELLMIFCHSLGNDPDREKDIGASYYLGKDGELVKSH